MRAKTMIAFWAAVAAGVFLLGGTVASVEAFFRHPSAENTLVLSMSLIGLVLAVLIAGRVVVVVGRAQRRSRLGEALTDPSPRDRSSHDSAKLEERRSTT